MAGKAREGFLERTSGKPGFQNCGGVKSDEMAFLEHRHAVRQEFDLLHRMGSEQKGCTLSRENLRLEETAKIGGGQWVEAPCGFVEQEDFRLMEERPQQTGPLNGTGRKSAYLHVENGT